LQSAGTTAITIDTSQNVGIGITSPSSKLEISDTSANGLRLKGAGDHAFGFTGYSGNAATQVFSIRNDGINNCYINTQNSVPLSFGVSTGTTFGSTTESMRIDSSGNVGVGVTPNAWANATAIQTAAGSIYSQQSGTYLILSNNSYYANAEKYIATGAASRMYFSGGTINTSTVASGTAGASFSWTAGPYVANLGTSWTSSSDERLKNITGEITNALDKVGQIRAAKFTWKADTSNKPQIGLIAQDLLQVLPEVVVVPEKEKSENGEQQYLGVNYTEVIPLLVASIKELKAINDTQAETINALTARIVAIESKA
jgi:hypothetical protein